MSLLHTFFSFFCFLLGWFYSLVIALIAVPCFLIHPPWGQICQRLFGLVNLWLMNVQVIRLGFENTEGVGGAILAPNHESLFDILVIASLPFDKAWLAKKQIKYIPLIGQVMQAMGSYFVDRNKREKDIKVLGEIEKALQNGARIVIFPEGTRTRTGQLLPFKKGAFRTAINAGVPLIPIAISGTFKIAPPGKWPKRNHKVRLQIGKPLHPSPLETVDSLMQRYHSTLTSMLKEPLKKDHK